MNAERTNAPDGRGRKIAIVTGATNGIGEITATEIARTGAKTILVGRSDERLETSANRIRAAVRDAEVETHRCDFSSIQDTYRVGKAIASLHPVVDILVNNAGALIPSREITSEGLEKTFATNHFGYFVLTEQLRPSLTKAGASRIVNVASNAHYRGHIDWDDLKSERGYKPFQVYSSSKLMNVLFTLALARRLADTGATANCLHPGVIASGFAQDAGGVFGFAWNALMRPFLKDPKAGARTSVFLATSPSVATVSGRYFDDKQREKPPSRDALDTALQEKLWSWSEDVVATTLSTSVDI